MRTNHNGIIDFHTHAFPDSLAPKAMAKLSAYTDIKPCLDGTISALLASMDSCGVERSVICCIATRPRQFESIFNWCGQIRKIIENFPELKLVAVLVGGHTESNSLFVRT